MFTGTFTLGDSAIKQNGNGNIGVGGIPFAGAKLGVTGNIRSGGRYHGKQRFFQGKDHGKAI